MSKMRHKKSGGKVEAYDAKDSNVEKEADEKKSGGRVKKAAGGKVEGGKPKERLDRPKRKDGGRVGSDKSPFSSASVGRVKEHSTDDM